MVRVYDEVVEQHLDKIYNKIIYTIQEYYCIRNGRHFNIDNVFIETTNEIHRSETNRKFIQVFIQ